MKRIKCVACKCNEYAILIAAGFLRRLTQKNFVINQESSLLKYQNDLNK